MTRVSWRVAEFLARALSPDEHEAVLGDLAEDGKASVWSLRGVLGLVIRRQVSTLTGWSAWIALFGIAVPAGLAISIGALWLARVYSLNYWLLVNNFDAASPAGAGVSPSPGIRTIVSCSLLLATWSWASGFVLGALSKRTSGISAVVLAGFFLALLWHDLVSGSFQFSMLILGGFCLAPAVFGLSVGHRERMRGTEAFFIWITAIIPAIGVPARFWWPESLRVWQLAVYCPLAYLITTNVFTPVGRRIRKVL